MPSKLSATAPSFSFPSKSSASVAESTIAIACRENEEIGTYKGGVLKPRKGITSRISWNECVPFATNARSATIEPVAASPHEESTIQLVTLPADTCAHETLQTHITRNDTSSIRHDEDLTFNMVQPDLAQESNYQTSTPQFHGLHEQFPGDHQLNHQAITHFYPPTYQLHVALPCDVVVSEANRPSWNPAYHRTISPSIERANRVVEEFKLYFGDGRSPELLLKNLQKICVLCGLSKADDMPTTSDECVTILKSVYVNVFDLVEAGRADQQGSGWAIQVPTFRSSKQFFEYSKEQGKVCPRWIGKANPLFQDVMNRFSD